MPLKEAHKVIGATKGTIFNTLNMDLFSELSSLMFEYRFKPERKFAQYFMVDEALISKIVGSANLCHDDVALEIGPGTGFLTVELLKHSKVVAVESEDTMCSILEKKFSAEINSGKLNLIKGDFLKVELPKFNKIVANVPYNISSDLIYYILNKGFETAVLTMQQEFIEKLTAFPGLTEYNAISVISQYYTKMDVVIPKIPPKSFFPKPSTFSAVIRLKFNEKRPKVKGEQLFQIFLREIFRLKNKNLSNSLSKSYQFLHKHLKLSKADFEKNLQGLPFADEKVYLLEVRDFVKIFNYLMA